MATYNTPSHIAYLWPAKMSQGGIPYTRVNKRIRLFPNLQGNMRLIISDLCCFFLWLVRRIFRDFAWVERAIGKWLAFQCRLRELKLHYRNLSISCKIIELCLNTPEEHQDCHLSWHYKGRRAGIHYILENDLKPVPATSLYDCPHRNWCDKPEQSHIKEWLLFLKLWGSINHTGFILWSWYLVRTYLPLN